MGLRKSAGATEGGVDTAVLFSEAGKGQSFPPYDLESECPQLGVTRGVLLS